MVLGLLLPDLIAFLSFVFFTEQSAESAGPHHLLDLKTWKMWQPDFLFPFYIEN